MQHPALSPGGGTKPGSALSASTDAQSWAGPGAAVEQPLLFLLGQPAPVKVPGEVQQVPRLLGSRIKPG